MIDLTAGRIIDSGFVGAGIIFPDRSGYRHHLLSSTLILSGWLLGTERGKAYYTSTDGFLSASTTSNIRGLSSITVCAWIRGANSAFSRLMSHSRPADNNRSWEVLVDDSNTTHMQVRLSVDGTLTGTTAKQYRGSLPAIDNANFHHLAFSYHGPTDTLQLYVDGKQDPAPTKVLDGVLRGLHATPAALRINGFDGYTAGTLAEVRVGAFRMWNRALPPQGIMADYIEGLRSNFS